MMAFQDVGYILISVGLTKLKNNLISIQEFPMCFSFLLFISFVSLVVFVVMDIKGTTKELFKVLFVL